MPAMDDAHVGSVFRAVRIRRGLRQSDVADKAGISRSEVSLLELGQLERLTLAAIRQIAQSLSISMHFEPRWRGPTLAVLLDEQHARLVGLMAKRLAKLGWIVHPEHTFAVFGENGSIDIFAWHPVLRVVLVIEVKSVLVDMQDTLSTMDRKRRLALRLAREMGWQPLRVGLILVMPSTHRSRNALERHSSLLAAALPARHLEVRAWLRRPDRDLRGVLLVNLPNDNTDHATQARMGGLRVRVRSKPTPHAQTEACLSPAEAGTPVLPA